MSGRARPPHGPPRLPSRRAFLRRLGAAAALLPFVPVLNASGQEALFPRRLVLFFTPHATFWPAWNPSGAGTAFTLGPILAPLRAHQGKLNVLRGVHMPDPPYLVAHTPGGAELWTGAGMAPADANFSGDHNTGASVDQVVAQRLAGSTTYASLQATLFGGQTTIFAGPGQPVWGESDAQATFARLFGTLSPQAISRRQSVLDVSARQLIALQPRLGAADRAKLDAHLTGLRTVEQSLQNKLTACAGPALSPLPAGVGQPASFPVDFPNHLDIFASALACDLTRVASIQFGQQDNDGWNYPFLGVQAGHHSLTHMAPSDTLDDSGNAVADPSRSVNGQLTKIYTFYAQNFARLLDRLDAVPEGDGTLLDHTLVIWGTELADYGTHGFGPSLPLVVAGGGGFGLQTGRLLDFAARPQPHNRLLVSAAQFMGLADVTSFGSLDPGSGPLPGL